MSRCCGGSSCACAILAGEHIQIEGDGSSQRPFEIIGDIDVQVEGTATFNLSRTGAGTVGSPWILSVAWASTATMADHPQWSDTAPTNGQVPKWNSGTGLWTPGAPTTAASGSVDTDTSLEGDGSVGDVLAVVHDPDRYTATTVDGIGLSEDGINSLVRRFPSAFARDAALPVPEVNSLSMLDGSPGRTDYWTGTGWERVHNGVTYDVAADTGQFLAMSGAYDGLGPIFVLIRQVATTTDTDGVFDVLTPDDLASKAGVLSLAFQESGSAAFKAVAYGNIDRVSAVAYRLDTGEAFSTQAVAGTVTAYCY